MYGPGRPLSALKHRHVSSTSTGPLTCSCSGVSCIPIPPHDKREQRAYDLGGLAALVARDVCGFALQLWHYKNQLAYYFDQEANVRSTFCERRLMLSPRMALTSSSFLALPTKVKKVKRQKTIDKPSTGDKGNGGLALVHTCPLGGCLVVAVAAHRRRGGGAEQSSCAKENGSRTTHKTDHGNLGQTFVNDGCSQHRGRRLRRLHRGRV